MTEELNLSLPERKKPAPQQSKALHVLVTVVLIAVMVNIVIALLQVRKGRRQEEVTAAGVIKPEALKELALKLEKRGLQIRAATAWEQYLAHSGANAEESARIWYRVGDLYQQAGEHAQALESYYRSESFAALTELAPEIGRRTQQCLEALGKFAALRYELAERVGIDTGTKTAGDKIVAEIGPQKITQAELDRKIEELIERQLSQFAAHLPEDECNKQKETLLERFSAPDEKLTMLNQMIVEDLLYRQARETKLVDDPRIRRLLKDAERNILAQQVVEKALADKIHITPADLETYYEAHKQEYITPEGEPERQRTFEEVRMDVFRALRVQKEREVQAALIEELRRRYDVVIHHSAFAGQERNNSSTREDN